MDSNFEELTHEDKNQSLEPSDNDVVMTEPVISRISSDTESITSTISETKQSTISDVLASLPKSTSATRMQKFRYKQE